MENSVTIDFRPIPVRFYYRTTWADLAFIWLPMAFSFGQPLDRFGGFTGIEGERTGRWHVEEINDRYWFVTPEGNAFYALGVNHITATDAREKKLAVEHLNSWKFNSTGYGPPEWMLEHYPGFVHVGLHQAVHWLPANRFGFADVFSEEFREAVENTIRRSCAVGKKYANVIGYSLTDTPRYDLDIIRTRRGADWVSYIRMLGAETAGKKRYVEFLKSRYDRNFEKFRAAYRLENIHSFDELPAYDFALLELTRPAVRQDDEAFMALIVETMYQLAKTYFDQYHPGALLLSEKFKMHDHPKEILKLAGKYFDVISIQPGPTHGPDVGQGPDESIFDPSYWKALHELTGKPVFITDHGFAFYTPEHPRTLWHQFHAEEKAADFYDRYLKQVIQEPYIIGYMKCQYKDRYDPLRDLLKQGLVKGDGSVYTELVEQVIQTNADVFKQLYK